MPRSPIVFALALLIVLAAPPMDRAKAGFGGIQGTWEVTVTPQATPDVPPPAPFQALFSFHFGGTLSETDGGIHPGSQAELFPELGTFSASDGLGVWSRSGHRRTALTFFKVLFVEQEQVGYLRIRGKVALSHDRKRFTGEALSDFILGPDLETGEIFFTGPVRLDGRRLGVVAATP
ncbi:MAG: hypothetical protein QNJ30_00625 [Kiloniellales bacterium]|nr:hypothetical protein [Kiloniellales bacterium]